MILGCCRVIKTTVIILKKLSKTLAVLKSRSLLILGPEPNFFTPGIGAEAGAAKNVGYTGAVQRGGGGRRLRRKKKNCERGGILFRPAFQVEMSYNETPFSPEKSVLPACPPNSFCLNRNSVHIFTASLHLLWGFNTNIFVIFFLMNFSLHSIFAQNICTRTKSRFS